MRFLSARIPLRPLDVARGCLLVIALLPLTRIFELNWLELIRLWVISVGLWYVVLRRKFVGVSDTDTPHEGSIGNTLGVLLPYLIYLYILIQFDPAYLNREGEQGAIPWHNWYFVANSILVLIASSAILLGKDWRHTNFLCLSGSLTGLDKSVFVAVIVLLLVVAATRMIVGKSDSLESVSTLVRIVVFGLLYVTIRTVFASSDISYLSSSDKMG